VPELCPVKKPYRLKKRGRYWQYKLPEETAFHSTGIEVLPSKDGGRARAESAVVAALASREVPAPPPAQAAPRIPSLREYTEDFFVWNRCGWLRWRIEGGHHIDRQYADSLRRYLVKWILPMWGDYRLDAIFKRDVKAWILTVPLGGRTRNFILGVFRRVMAQAEEDQLIPRSPLHGVGRLAPAGRRRDIFELSEIQLMFPDDVVGLLRIWTNYKMAVFFVVLASTGMRQGECRALRWRHVLWNDQALLIEVAAKRKRIGPTKSRKIRIALLSDRAISELDLWRALTRRQDLDDLIFPGRTPEHPMDAKTPELRLEGAIKAAGIVRGDRNLVVHSLRHTVNTRLRREISPGVLRDLIGHTTEEMTDWYDHPQIAELLAALKTARGPVGKLLG
jgi:integrase